MKPIRVAAPLPDIELPSADWADRYEIELPNGQLMPIEAARLALDRAPAWFRFLLRLRNLLVAPFGLKTGAHPGEGKAIGIFPIISENDREAVLGFDDRHLNFRVIVDVRHNLANGQVVGMTTLVHRKNLFGRAYIAIITPFHRAIVKTFLAKLGKSAAAVN